MCVLGEGHVQFEGDWVLLHGFWDRASGIWCVQSWAWVSAENGGAVCGLVAVGQEGAALS